MDQSDLPERYKRIIAASRTPQAMTQQNTYQALATAALRNPDGFETAWGELPDGLRQHLDAKVAAHHATANTFGEDRTQARRDFFIYCKGAASTAFREWASKDREQHQMGG